MVLLKQKNQGLSQESEGELNEDLTFVPQVVRDFMGPCHGAGLHKPLLEPCFNTPLCHLFYC